MTISSVSAGAVVDPTWGNAVAASINNIEAAWTSFTPTIGNLTVGATTFDCKYNQFGKTVLYAGRIVLGTGFAITGNLTLQPPTFIASVRHGGFAEYLDSGSAFYAGGLKVVSSSSIEFHQPNAGSNSGRTNASVPFAFGVADELTFNIVYEST